MARAGPPGSRSRLRVETEIYPPERCTAVICPIYGATRPHLPRKFHPRDSMNYKVLVVDDSRLARMVMASAFRRLRPDWELIEATGIGEALGAIQIRPGRHRIDRFQHAGPRRPRAGRTDRERAPEMPIAVVSANLQDEIVARTRELKAAFIPKPLSDETLGAFLSGAALRLRKAKQ